MKLLSWKLWIPVMFVFVIGWGLTGPAMQQELKVSLPTMEEKKSDEPMGKGFGKGFEKSSRPRVHLPPPPPPAPESTRVRDIFLYGSVFSILVNFINFLEKVTKLTRRIWKK